MSILANRDTRIIAQGIALATVALATATPAAAQSFETFKRFCLETDGAPESTVAALRQAGWQTDPRNANLPAGSTVTLMSDPATGALPAEMVMSGFIPIPTGASLPACSVMGPVVEEAELVQKLTDWTGFEPVVSAQGWLSWTYSGGPGQMTAQPDLIDADFPELQAAAQARGTLHGIQIRTARAGPFLFRTTVFPDTATPPID